MGRYLKEEIWNLSKTKLKGKQDIIFGAVKGWKSGMGELYRGRAKRRGMFASEIGDGKICQRIEKGIIEADVDEGDHKV